LRARQAGHTRHTCRLDRHERPKRAIHSRGAVLRDATGQSQRMVGTVQDVTEHMQAEEALAAKRERAARLSGMLFTARQLASQLNHNLVT
jgi:hypothetical protein